MAFVFTLFLAAPAVAIYVAIRLLSKKFNISTIKSLLIFIVIYLLIGTVFYLFSSLVFKSFTLPAISILIWPFILMFYVGNAISCQLSHYSQCLGR